MADLKGLALQEDEREFLMHPYLGGIILFARNFASIEQVTDLVAQIRDVREELIIAVDQEGGRVQRFKEGFTRLPPVQCFNSFLHKDEALALALAENCGWVMAGEVRSTGVDFSFAPVVDVDKDLSSIIGDRSFGEKFSEVVNLAGAFIKGMHAAGMPSTGKHFPGHGAVVADSHLETPVDDRSLEDILKRDVEPFAALIDQNLIDGIMPAHVVYSQLDEKPAVFSRFWLQEVLRGQLNFNGVIFSDDLCMEGAAMIGSFAQRAEEAMQAGCDMVLVCNNRSAADEVLSALEKNRAPINDCFEAFRTREGVLSHQQVRSDERFQICQQQGLFSEQSA